MWYLRGLKGLGGSDGILNGILRACRTYAFQRLSLTSERAKAAKPLTIDLPSSTKATHTSSLECLVTSEALAPDPKRCFPKIGGPQYRPQYTIVLIMGNPQ